MAEPRWLNVREDRLWRAFLQMQRALDRAIDRQLTAAGLSRADYDLLAPLSEAPPEGTRARDLGQRVGWDRSRLSHQLRRMEKRGLITRHDCSTDARGTVIRVTAAGRDAVEAAAPGHVDTVRRHLVDLLDVNEADLLTTVFERVRDHAADTTDLAEDHPPRPGQDGSDGSGDSTAGRSPDGPPVADGPGRTTAPE